MPEVSRFVVALFSPMQMSQVSSYRTKSAAFEKTFNFSLSDASECVQTVSFERVPDKTQSIEKQAAQEV